jgi:hypothetical protein
VGRRPEFKFDEFGKCIILVIAIEVCSVQFGTFPFTVTVHLIGASVHASWCPQSLWGGAPARPCERDRERQHARTALPGLTWTLPITDRQWHAPHSFGGPLIEAWLSDLRAMIQHAALAPSASTGLAVPSAWRSTSHEVQPKRSGPSVGTRQLHRSATFGETVRAYHRGRGWSGGW